VGCDRLPIGLFEPLSALELLGSWAATADPAESTALERT
jgi:hypothetical protein